MMQYVFKSSVSTLKNACARKHAYLCEPGHACTKTDDERALLNCGATIFKYSKSLIDKVLYSSKMK